MNRKVLITAILSLCCVICFCGCGGHIERKFDREAREELKTVQEWADAVGILEKEGLEIYDFQKNSFGVWVDYLVGGPTMIEDFSELITASNQFLEEHPDYFPRDDFQISFCGVVPSRLTNDFVLSNRLITDQFDISMIDINVEEGEKLQFFYMEMETAVLDVLRESEDKLEISVLLLDSWHGDIVNQATQDLSYLDCFEGLQYIVINIPFAEIDDYTILKNRIEEYVPGCEVYILDRGESLVKKDHNLSEKSQNPPLTK